MSADCLLNDMYERCPRGGFVLPLRQVTTRICLAATSSCSLRYSVGKQRWRLDRPASLHLQTTMTQRAYLLYFESREPARACRCINDLPQPPPIKTLEEKQTNKTKQNSFTHETQSPSVMGRFHTRVRKPSDGNAFNRRCVCVYLITHTA